PMPAPTPAPECGDRCAPKHVHVVECTHLEVVQLTNCTYEFRASVSFEEGALPLVSFAPVDACAPLANRTLADNVDPVLFVAQGGEASFCDALARNESDFERASELFAQHGWHASLHHYSQHHVSALLTATFSLEELLAAGAVAASQQASALHYEGALTLALVKPRNCSALDDDDDTDATDANCTCTLRFAQRYTFAIDVARNGTLTVGFR